MKAKNVTGKEHLERNDFIIEKQKAELQRIDAAKRHKEQQVELAEQELKQVKSEIRTDKLKSAATDAATVIASGVGSLFGSGFPPSQCPSSLCRNIWSGVMPQRLWHSSPNSRTSASVVSGLMSSTPSRMGEHPATLIILPFFPLRDKESFQVGGKWFKPNYHAHIVFDWMNHDTGKSRKLNDEDMAAMQTLASDILMMERGQSKNVTIQFLYICARDRKEERAESA